MLRADNGELPGNVESSPLQENNLFEPSGLRTKDHFELRQYNSISEKLLQGEIACVKICAQIKITGLRGKICL